MAIHPTNPDIAWVAARASVDANTVALVLTDPDGVKYGSGVSEPQLAPDVSVGAPGKAGTWKITVRGIGSVSGVALDPLRLTNGYALPGNVSGEITLYDNQGYTGLADIGAHPAKGAIEYAVSRRYVDALDGGRVAGLQRLRHVDGVHLTILGQEHATMRVPGQQQPVDGAEEAAACCTISHKGKNERHSAEFFNCADVPSPEKIGRLFAAPFLTITGIEVGRDSDDRFHAT